MTAIEKLIQTAKNEIGYLEKRTNSQLDDKTANAGYNNYTKYARDLDNIGFYNGPKNGYAWCDCYVDWCFVKTFGVDMAMKLTGQSKGCAGAGCTYSAGYYKSMGRFYTKNPQPGDQIFFGTSQSNMTHTGIVTKVSGGRVYTIEGNTSSAAGVVANGGAVRDKSYALTYPSIQGYGRPRWDLVGESGAPVSTEKAVDYQGKVTASALNCRDYPVSGDVVLVYDNGDMVHITKEDDGWGYTGKGWVSLQYIERVVTETTPKVDVPSTTNDKDFTLTTKTVSIDDKDYTVTSIMYKGENYIRLRDFFQAGYTVDYDSKEKLAMINHP